MNYTEKTKEELIQEIIVLQQSLRKVFSTSPDSVNINRLSDGMYISINPGFTKMLGYTEEEVIGKTSLELNIWADLSSRELIILSLKKEGKFHNLEGVFKHKDGSLRYGIISASIIELDGIQHIISITRDITDYKTTIDVLKKKNEFMQAIIDNLPIGLAVNEFDSGVASYMNQKFSDIYGWPAENIKNISQFFELVYPDAEYRKEISEQVSADVTSRDINRMHWDCIKIQTKETGERYVSATNIPLFEQNIMISTVRDITDLKLSEDALKESERLLRESQEVAHLGSFVWDIKIGLWKSSKILDEIFGIDEMYIRSFEGWLNLVHPDWQTIMKDYVTTEVLGKHKKFDKEYQIIRHNDKQILWVHGISELEFDKNNQPLLLIGTISDITDRKLAEIELLKSHEELEKSKLAILNLLEDVIQENSARKISEENYRKAEIEISQLNRELEKRVIQRTAQLNAANKELEAFAYSVSHDLRAPLRAIDGFSKFVIEDYSGNLEEEGKRLLGLIRKNAMKMDQLITNILALSRVTRGEHSESDIDMTKMVMSMYIECVTPETRKKLNFSIDNLPVAFGDPIYLKQVWTNLISNAVKFSSLKSKPVINVGGRIENGFNIYHIRDNGAGFNPEYAHKLFGVFQRLHKIDEFEGTGVGLAIVQRIILRHGGTVWAEAKEGEGATFYFSIPVKKEITGNR